MASFPSCTTPSNVIINVSGTTLNVSWQGSANTYKMAYKKETDVPWQVLSFNGPGSNGGSGAMTDDTGGVTIPTSPVSSASFIVTGLTPGIYDLRLINICQDGTDFTLRKKFAIEQNIGSIPNLRLQTDPGTENQINIEWDAPTTDSGQRFGQKIDCDNVQLAASARKYSIILPGPGFLVIFVSQKAANGFQYSTSNALYVEGINCDTGCIYQPFTLETESSI
jgi:hypothetical protein